MFLKYSMLSLIKHVSEVTGRHGEWQRKVYSILVMELFHEGMIVSSEHAPSVQVFHKPAGQVWCSTETDRNLVGIRQGCWQNLTVLCWDSPNNLIRPPLMLAMSISSWTSSKTLPAKPQSDRNKHTQDWRKGTCTTSTPPRQTDNS